MEMTKEEVYDAEVAPHITEVLKICKRRGIAVFMNFELDDDLRCTSAIVDETNRYSLQMRAMIEIADVYDPIERRDLDGTVVKLSPEGS